jgi:NTE family protein
MEDKLLVLKQVPVLASLGEELMKDLADQAEMVAIKKGDLVVREDDPGDALYVVVSGRLQAYTRLKSGGERVFSTYTNGDCFGEMPLLSGETHWANVRTLNDSVLLKIPRAVFDQVVERDPRVAHGFTRRLGQRIKELRAEKKRAKWSTILGLYSAMPGVGKTLLATNLVASLAHETSEPVLLLDFSGRHQSEPLARCASLDPSGNTGLGALKVHTTLGYDRISLELTGDEKEPAMIAPLFGQLVKHYDYVLVELPNEASPAVLVCLQQADQILVMTRADDAHLEKTRVLLADLRAHGDSVAPKAKVILTGITETRPSFIPETEEKLGEHVCCMLRWVPESDMVPAADGTPLVLRKPMDAYSFCVRRMARELGHTLVGLALGAGGARGLAHIGVIRVLEQEGITVDLIAGSSMGSLIAAAWAVGKTADEMEALALSIKTKRAFLKLLDPMFPGAGIFRGMRVLHFLKQIVGDLTFADTIIPVKVVATDLNSTAEVVFDEGKLSDAIRASISIPGVFRPVQDNGYLLVDGGIANPVPVNVIAHEGVTRIIAVNTIPSVEQMAEHRRYRSEILQARRRKPAGTMRETGPVIETPTNIIDVYMRSMYAMQSHISEEACANADVVVRTFIPEGVWYDFYNPEKYIRCGEQAARNALPALKELVRA